MTRKLTNNSRFHLPRIQEVVQLLQLTFDWRPRPQPVSLEKVSSDDLELLWQSLVTEFFPAHTELLLSYTLRWATKPQVTTLASCNVERRRILVAPAMQLIECREHLPALLYHEMCHAVLGKPEVVGGRRKIHTREFKELESRHPSISNLDRWIKQGGWFAVARAHRRRWKLQRTRLARAPLFR